MKKIKKVKSQLSAAEAKFMVDKLCSLSPGQQDMVDQDKRELDEAQNTTQDLVEENDHGEN